MDIIRKKICIEDARTRTQGLVPFYEIGKEYALSVSCDTVNRLNLSVASGYNGNWGQIVADPCFLHDSGKSYKTMLDNYYSILNLVRRGVKLHKVETPDGVIFTQILDSFSLNGEQCFSEETEPDYLYLYGAYNSMDFYSTGYNVAEGLSTPVYKKSDDDEVKDKYIVLIDDYDAFVSLSSYLNNVYFPQQLDIDTTIPEDEPHKWVRYCEVVDFFIGKIYVPASIFNKHVKVPKSMSCSDIVPYKKWLEDNRGFSGDCCDGRLWYDMGGDDMIEFLSGQDLQNKYQETMNILNGLEYFPPSLNVSLFLDQNITDVGLLTSVDGKEYDGSEYKRPHGSDASSFIKMGQSRVHYRFDESDDDWEEFVGRDEEGNLNPISGDGEGNTYITSEMLLESLLQTLRSEKKYFDDDDNLLPGLFQKFENEPFGKMFECKKQDDGSWDIFEYIGTEPENGDGMTSEEIYAKSPKKYYRTITIAAAGKRLSEMCDEEFEMDGDDDTGPITSGYSFYYKVKYNNSEDFPMTLPYASGNTTNRYFVTSGSVQPHETYTIYRCDILSAITEEDGNETGFTYVIGGKIKEYNNGKLEILDGTGDVYKEKHKVIKGYQIYANIDGADNVPIYVDFVDFSNTQKEFYSPRFDLNRIGYVANLVEATTGEIWDSDNSFDAYLLKEDYLLNSTNIPKVDVNVTIDRGGASAFERHFKLGECNTMRDLENYNNGEFLPEM